MGFLGKGENEEFWEFWEVGDFWTGVQNQGFWVYPGFWGCENRWISCMQGENRGFRSCNGRISSLKEIFQVSFTWDVDVNPVQNCTGR